MKTSGFSRPAVWLFTLAVFSLTLAFARRAEAHTPSDSYLTLTVHGARVDGRWDVAIRDLDYAMGLDRDANGSVTWGELRAREDEIASFALGHLTVRAGDAVCRNVLRGLEVASHSDGTYAVLLFDALCAAEPKTLDVDYELFFDFDPQHHGIVRVDDGAGTRTAIFTPEDRRQKFEQTTVAPGHQPAIVTCYEGTDDEPAHLAATNVFVLEDGRWRMVHHHAGPISSPVPRPPPALSMNRESSSSTRRSLNHRVVGRSSRGH